MFKPQKNIFLQMHMLRLLSCFSCVQPFAALQASLSMGFSRQEYWSGLLSCPPPEDLPNPEIEIASVYVYLHWQAGSLPLAPPEKPQMHTLVHKSIENGLQNTLQIYFSDWP